MERDARLALHCQDPQFKIAVREHQRQAGMPSIRLLENLHTITKLWWCKNFKVFRLLWRTIGRTWKKGGTDAWIRSTRCLYVVKDAFCCMNINVLFKAWRKVKEAADVSKQTQRSFFRESRYIIKAKRWIHVQSLSKIVKLDPEDWLVLNFELSKESGYVNHPNHQTTVKMRHHPTMVTRKISILSFYWSSDSLCPSTQSVTPDRFISQEESIYQSKGKGKRTESEQEKVTVAIVNVGNHRPRITTEKLLHFQNSMNSHLTAERNIEQITRSRTPMKGIIELERKLPSEQGRIKFSYQSLKRARLRDKFPSLNVIQTGTTVRPKMYRVKWAARKRICKAQSTRTSQRALQERTLQGCPQNKTSSEAMPWQRRRIPRQAWRYIPKKGCTWSTVAQRYIRRDDLLWITEKSRLLDSLATFWILWPPMAPLSQTHKRRSTSRNLALVCGYIWWKILHQCHRWEDYASNLGHSYSWPTGDAPRVSKGKKEIESNIENFVPLITVTKQKTSTIPWILDSQGKPWAGQRSGGHHVGSVGVLRNGRKSSPQSEKRNSFRHSCKSGLPEEWWDCAMECQCYFRNVQDTMAWQHSRRDMAKQFDGPSIPFGSLVEYIPLTAKDKSSVHLFWKKAAERNIIRLRALCGEEVVRRVDDSNLWRFARIRSLRYLHQEIQKPRNYS